MFVSNPLEVKTMAFVTLKLTLLAGFMVALSSCSNVQSALGLGKSPPDEFAVVTKAPLIVPPDFSLRPPRPGAPRPQELQPTETARRALLGEELGESEVGPSKGEVALLVKAGADRVDPNIRRVLSDETGGTRQKDQAFADRVLFHTENNERSSRGPAEAVTKIDSVPEGGYVESEDEDDSNENRVFFRSDG